MNPLVTAIAIGFWITVIVLGIVILFYGAIIALIVYIVFIAAKFIIKKIKKRNEINKENKIRIDKIDNVKSEIKKATISLLSEINNDVVIIDSDAWMNYSCDAFFYILKELLIRSGGKILICGAQFDEICNLKSRSDYDSESESSKKSRMAISRIEDFQICGILIIIQININSDRNAYADPYIIKTLIHSARSGYSVTLISNDSELRVRAREIIKQNGGQKYSISKIDDVFFKINNLIRNGNVGSIEDYSEIVKNAQPIVPGDAPPIGDAPLNLNVEAVKKLALKA